MMMMGNTKGLFLSLTTTLRRKTSTHLINYKPYSFSSSFCVHASTTSANNGGTTVGITTKVEGKNENYSTKGDGYDEVYLKRAGLRPERMPKHVAVTLDGGRRWSEKYNSGKLTYIPFFNSYLMLADLCIKLGIPTATWFIFATCTWKRTDEANNLLFGQLQEILVENLEKFTRQGIKVSVIGEKWTLPVSFQDMIKRVEEATKNCTTLHMMYAIPYGGRSDIIEATRNITRKVIAGEMEPEDVNEDLVEQHLSTGLHGVSNPELMIRTGAKNRVSNFYLWQSAHAELYFSNLVASEFGEAHFLQALRWFQQRERRFGK